MISQLTTLREARPRAKYVHRCNCCQQDIEIGTVHHLYVMHDPDALTRRQAIRQWRVHLVCPTEVTYE